MQYVIGVLVILVLVLGLGLKQQISVAGGLKQQSSQLISSLEASEQQLAQLMGEKQRLDQALAEREQMRDKLQVEVSAVKRRLKKAEARADEKLKSCMDTVLPDDMLIELRTKAGGHEAGKSLPAK